MGKKMKRAIWLAVGVTAGVLVAGAAKKVKDDIDTIVDEDRNFGEKTKEWFSEKRKIFAQMIEEKKTEIEEVSAKLKEDVIKEIDEAKRKELVEKATRRIAELKGEIKEISSKRRDEFVFYMRKMNATKIANAAHSMGLNVKKKVCEKFTSAKKPATDMDFDVDIDIDLDLELEE